MNDKKVKECIIFFVCRAGMYPFNYNNVSDPFIIFFEKLMKQNNLKLDIPSCGNDLIEYLENIISDMDESLVRINIFQFARRDYDSKILSKDEVSILEGILSDMIKESRRMYENSPDSYICEDSSNSIILN